MKYIPSGIKGTGKELQHFCSTNLSLRLLQFAVTASIVADLRGMHRFEFYEFSWIIKVARKGVCSWGSIDGDWSWWHQEGQHHSKLLHFWYIKKSLLPVGSSVLVPPALEGNNSSRVRCSSTTILRKLPMSVNSNCAQHVLDLEMFQRVAQQDQQIVPSMESTRVIFK